MKQNLLMILLMMCLLCAGCSKTDPMETRPPDIEPTATYDWMAGESPVPVKRIGQYRYGPNFYAHAVSASGTYFLDESALNGDHYIYYADHGSDTVVKLCGRADCTHDNKDCNAYLYMGMCLSYTNGYLYAVSGQGDEYECELIRMEPDGSGRVAVLDLVSFVRDEGGDFLEDAFISDGVLFFTANYYEVTIVGLEIRRHGMYLDDYYYKLDGSMEKPEPITDDGSAMYACGDVLLFLSGEAQQGGEHGSRLAWDRETNTTTYLTDAVSNPGYYNEDEVYYFRDGGIWRKTYADNQETLLAETGLEGDYVLYPFPDCLMVISRDAEEIDPNLYIYNWAFEPVDTVTLDYPYDDRTIFLLIAETAERFILADGDCNLPKYYINKSELGTGNVEIHEFNVA